MREKRITLLSLSIIFLITSFSLVSAQTPETSFSKPVENLGELVTAIYNSGIQPLAKFLIGGEAAGDQQTFFALILLFVLLVSFLWLITNRVPIISENTWLQFVVSFAISLISIRFIAEAENTAWFKTILIPNQALGIVLLSLLPLIIYFFFVEDIGSGRPVLRKIMWVFAAVVFLALYLTRYADLASSKGAEVFNPANIYLLTFVLCFGLLLLDGTIAKAWHKGRAEAAGARAGRQFEEHILEQISRVKKLFSEGAMTEKDYEQRMKELQKRYAKLKTGS